MYSAGLVNFHILRFNHIYLRLISKDIISKITLNKSTYLNNQDFNYTIFKNECGNLFIYFVKFKQSKAVCELFIVSHTA